MNQLVNNSIKLMGNQFEIIALDTDSNIANEAIKLAIDEIKRIESLFTIFDDKSIVQKINNNAGKSPTEVPIEIIELIQRANKISKLTDGLFDITYGALSQKIWKFESKTFDLNTINLSNKKYIDYKKIEIDHINSTVFLPFKEMKISFGGIGKGYAADSAKKIMKMNGIENGVVNASGDITCWATNLNNQKWKVGIVDPNLKNTIFSTMSISNASICTSGNYEKYKVMNNRIYSHTVDPSTGMPIEGLKSVTTISPYAEFCDAINKPIQILGIEKEIEFTNKIDGLECIIVGNDNKIYCSSKINIKNEN